MKQIVSLLLEVIGDMIVIASGIILLVHFLLFWFCGWIYIGESSRKVLAGETFMAVVIIGVGFYLLWVNWKNSRKGDEEKRR